MNSLFQLIGVHFKTFLREPAILFWAVLFPILMAWILGIARHKVEDYYRKRIQQALSQDDEDCSVEEAVTPQWDHLAPVITGHWVTREPLAIPSTTSLPTRTRTS